MRIEPSTFDNGLSFRIKANCPLLGRELVGEVLYLGDLTDPSPYLLEFEKTVENSERLCLSALSLRFLKIMEILE